MKFIFTINRLHIGSGGAQKVASLLCNGLSKLGNEVLLILYEDRTDHDYYLSDSVNVVVLPKKEKTENKVSYAVKKLSLLRESIFQFDPDVIITFLSDPTFYTYLSTRFSKYQNRIVTTVRNNPRLFPTQKRYRWRNNVLMALNKACFFQNTEQRDYFPAFIKKKSFVLPNPVSDDWFEIEKPVIDIKRMISVGRLSEQKNQKLLIKAVALLIDRFPDLSLDIFGEGDMRDELQKEIEALKLENVVRLRGITNDVKSELLEHGLFVMTSNYEGMPNALIEAMAVGIPCISTDCPTGPSDLIKQKDNGLLIPMDNVEACTSAIEYMLNNQEQATKMGKAAKHTIKDGLSCSDLSEKLVAYCKEYVIDR